MRNWIFTICAYALLFGMLPVQAQEPLYKNEDASIEARVNDLLGRMTVDEKIDLMRATSPANERLGIAKYYHGNEALHGVVRPGSRFSPRPSGLRQAGIRS